jgi:D-lactate dehydrogenase (cytochrome)
VTDPLQLDALRSIADSDPPDLDPSRRRALSRDLASTPDDCIAVAILRPRSEQAVSVMLETCARLGLGVSVRGAGLSYSGGYAPRHERTVLLDLRGLDRVLAVDVENRVVVAQAGCCWADLDAALRPHGLECVVEGPTSGLKSTLGGALSQGLPCGLDGVVGLRVALPDGSRLALGALGARAAAGAFRQVGPDLMGPFLGDAGSFGVKTAVALRLQRRAAAARFEAWSFATLAEALRAAQTVCADGLARRALILEDWRQRDTKRGAAEAPSGFIASAWRRRRSLPSFARDLGYLAASLLRSRRRHDEHLPWRLHVVIEGRSERDCDERGRLARQQVPPGARPADTAVARALHLNPYSLAGIAGPDGERWLPVHGLFPPSLALRAAGRVESYLSDRLEELSAKGISFTMLLAVRDSGVVIEPMFLWPDAVPEVVLEALSARRGGLAAARAPNASATALVHRHRRAIAQLLRDAGGIHLQLGKYYPYDELVPSTTGAFAADLKRLLDPDGTLSAGNLGLPPQGEPRA